MSVKPTENEPPAMDGPPAEGAVGGPDAAARVGELRPGETWGKFLIEKRLGRGEQTFVYQAYDRSGVAGRVALKLPRRPPPPQDVAAWLANEAGPVQRLEEHPGVVRVIDAGCINGLPYTAAPLTDAAPLPDYVEAHPPSAGQIADWAIDLADALDAAHSEGVVHRDLKPDNILIGQGAQPLIADFGITGAAADREGGGAGARAFQAPEQARRDPDADHRVDVFGLGALIKYLLTGTGPYGRAADAAKAAREARIEPIDPRRGWVLRRGLARAANRALAPLPEDRYATAGQMARSLRRLRGLSRLLPMAAAVVLAVAAGALIFLLLAD